MLVNDCRAIECIRLISMAEWQILESEKLSVKGCAIYVRLGAFPRNRWLTLLGYTELTLAQLKEVNRTFRLIILLG